MSEIKEYMITADKCMEMVGDRVCPGCGGKLTPIETVDNANNPTFWAGCEDEACSRFSWGTELINFQIANKMVREHNYIEYGGDGKYGKEGFELEYWYRSQINGASFTVRTMRAIESQLITLQND